jgi:hypothetical protein
MALYLRLIIFSVGLSLMFPVLGCEFKKNQVNRNVEEEYSKVDIHSMKEKAKDDTFEDLYKIKSTKVSFFSKNNIEVIVAPEPFQEKWVEYVSTLKETDPYHFELVYTIIIWDRDMHPYVIQLARDGMKIGQRYYLATENQLFIQWVKNYIGEKYINSFLVEGLYLEALDLKLKRQVSDQLMKEVLEVLQQSTLVKGEKRADTPLFPYYRLILAQKEKENIEMDIITPTLVRVNDGNDRWYYQLNDSLYTYLKSVIPVKNFPPSNIRSLFTAEEVGDEAERESPASGTQPLEDESKVHDIARLLIKGIFVGEENKMGESVLNSKKDKEDGYAIHFFYLDGSIVKVKILDNHFVFDNSLYQLDGVGKMIKGKVK